jgi:hypothetical protein
MPKWQANLYPVWSTPCPRLRFLGVVLVAVDAVTVLVAVNAVTVLAVADWQLSCRGKDDSEESGWSSGPYPAP